MSKWKNELIRPTHGYGFYEVPKGLPVAAVQSLRSRALAVAAGVDELTAAERLAYYVLLDSGFLEAQ